MYNLVLVPCVQYRLFIFQNNLDIYTYG